MGIIEPSKQATDWVMKMAITNTTINENGKKVVTAVYRGTEYTLYELGGDWWCGTQRLSLGKWNAGGGKYYKTLNEVADKCKAFGGISELMKAFYGFDINKEIA